MDIQALVALYPVLKPLIDKAPDTLRKWITDKAKAEDAAFLFQLQSLQAITEIKQATEGLQANMLTTAIMSAMLANKDLKPEEIKARFIASAEVAASIQNSLAVVPGRGR